MYLKGGGAERVESARKDRSTEGSQGRLSSSEIQRARVCACCLLGVVGCMRSDRVYSSFLSEHDVSSPGSSPKPYLNFAAASSSEIASV